jgi:EAL domain-containing protein (putative c-di-GMP-specific phosphodiesterase class I)
VLVNSSTSDLLDADLYSSASPLGAVASRVALDLADSRALFEIPEIERRVAELKALGYRIAVSVRGNHYLDPHRFALLSPDILKIDLTRHESMSQSATHRHGIEIAVEWCAQHGCDLVVEGVERDEERNRLLTFGCKLFQDCLFASPARKMSRG